MDYLSVLNEAQKNAVLYNDSPLLILAGAGSGKTRVITTKIAYLIGQKNVDPYSILAVTFTKKAAVEMKERAQLLEESAQYTQIRTFHSFGAWFLRSHSGNNLAPHFTIYDDDAVSDIIMQLGFGLQKREARIFARKISRAKDYCLLPNSDTLAQIDESPLFYDIYSAYDQRLRETGNADFGDLILLPYLLLKNNADIRQKITSRFNYLLVDEYQDSNVAQFNLLQQLYCDNTFICVVGDDDQSIYKFRGAEVQNILSFNEHFENTKIIRLEKNYRSFAPILAIADNVVSNNIGRLGKTLQAMRGEGELPELFLMPKHEHEAHFCATLISDSARPYRDWAILYRTNAQSVHFETELLRRKIPYVVIGSFKFFEREEVKDMLAFLDILSNPRDTVAFNRIINKPTRGIGKIGREKIIQYVLNSEETSDFIYSLEKAGEHLAKKAKIALNEFASMLQNLHILLTKPEQSSSSPKTIGFLIEQILEKSQLKEYYEADDIISGAQRIANVEELENIAQLYPLNLDGLTAFLDHVHLDRTVSGVDDESDDKVVLITLHNTKGLEFPNVIITGLENGIFPREGESEEELEEERRLFYVGITRAKDRLFFTSCRERFIHNMKKIMQPSMFLNEIDSSLLKTTILSYENFPSTEQQPQHSRYRYDKDRFMHRKSNYEKDFDDEISPLQKKWAVGVKLYHDDWGYGIIEKTRGEGNSDDSYVIFVRFETGQIKRFMPNFQGSQLLIIND